MLMKIPALEKVLCIQKEAARDYKQEYRDYHGKPAQIKERAQRNAARSNLGLRRGDPREADHKNPISNGGSNSSRNLRAVSQATNRKKGAAVQKEGDWSEDKHPRAANGQFGSGSGGSSGKGKESAGAKRKRTTQARRAEGTAQTTLGTDAGRKAVQSLISGGGSALDKVSWFKPPEKMPEAAKEPSQGSAKPTQVPAIESKMMQSDIDRGLLRGIRVGTKPETKIKELAAIGLISWDHENNYWQSGRGGTSQNAKDLLLAYSDYRPIGERLAEFEADYKNLQRQGAPIGQEFPKAKLKLDSLRAEHERLYGAKTPATAQKMPEAKPKKKPGKIPVPYGIDPKHDPQNVLDLVHSRAKYGDIGETRVQQLHIMNAVEGIKYALETGRLHGYADITMRHLSGGDMARLVNEISSKELSQADIPRYLNQRYTAPEKKPEAKPEPIAEEKPKEPEKPPHSPGQLGVVYQDPSSGSWVIDRKKTIEAVGNGTISSSALGFAIDKHKTKIKSIVESIDKLLSERGKTKASVVRVTPEFTKLIQQRDQLKSDLGAMFDMVPIAQKHEARRKAAIEREQKEI